MTTMHRTLIWIVLSLLVERHSLAGPLETLLGLDPDVYSPEEQRQLSGMVSRDIERRRRLAIRRENEAWDRIATRRDWEEFRDRRLAALRSSLGGDPAERSPPDVRVTGRLEGDGYSIENVVFTSRPGLVVTANLYLPLGAAGNRPAVLLSHSHHAPKTQRELQHMGMTWARQGWVVLAMDHLGHGERRQHPFVDTSTYAGEFRVGRQDYYFRYNVGLQLHLIGESLMGWMVRDLRRGLDVLLARQDVDPDRVILIGAVAGGGDPAAVTAALDPRVRAVVPFNFGGPQPDYAVPRDARGEFYYFGVAYWEMTRCLRLGGRDGFAHWVIAGSVAPRALIYAHEFAWDPHTDPVWPRLERVYGLYDARERLASATGHGTLRGRPPESSHCTNVGAVHRAGLYPHFERWFAMPPPEADVTQIRDARELISLTPPAARALRPRRVHEIAAELADGRLQEARKERVTRRLRHAWAALLGDVQPGAAEVVVSRSETRGGIRIERIALRVEDGITVPLCLLRSSRERRSAPIVLAFARGGKKRLLQTRAPALAELLAGGAAVCLADLRGSGETDPGGAAGPRSAATALSSRDQVLGQTQLGARLRDVRSVLGYLRRRDDIGGRPALWGDSLAAANPAELSEVVPHGVQSPLVEAEPTAGLTALLAALFEEDVTAVAACGALASFQSLLESQFLYVPHDAVVPGVLAASDVCDLIAALAPRAVRLERTVNGLNRLVSAAELTSSVALAVSAYEKAGAREAFSWRVRDVGTRETVSRWLLSAAPSGQRRQGGEDEDRQIEKREERQSGQHR